MLASLIVVVVVWLLMLASLRVVVVVWLFFESCVEDTFVGGDDNDSIFLQGSREKKGEFLNNFILCMRKKTEMF